MTTRRQIIVRAITGTAATLLAAVGIGHAKPQRPTKLRAGQVWRDRTGDLRLVLEADYQRMCPMRGMWLFWCFRQAPGGLVGTHGGWASQEAVLAEWAYLGDLVTLGGGR